MNYELKNLLFGASQIRTVAGVNLDEVALVDEQGNTNLNTSLQRSGLQGVGSGVALDAGLGVGDAQNGLHRHLGVENGAGVGR